MIKTAFYKLSNDIKFKSFEPNLLLSKLSQRLPLSFLIKMYMIYRKNTKKCTPLPSLAHNNMLLFLFVNMCLHIKQQKNKKHAFRYNFYRSYQNLGLSVYHFLTLFSNSFLNFYTSGGKWLWVHVVVFQECLPDRMNDRMNERKNERAKIIHRCLFHYGSN